MNADPSKFEGCLLGLAIGDALGMPFEGWRPISMVNKLGGRLADFVACPERGLKAGQWTDDTKMALALLRSILRAGKLDPADVAKSYVEWFETGDLRGIGKTCLESIMKLKADLPWTESGRRGEMAAGNGTAMRTAPIGLLRCESPEKILEDSRLDAIITHNNDEAVAGSRAVNFFISQGVTQADFRRATPDLIDRCVEFIGGCEVAKRLLRAKELLVDGMPGGTALQTLGTGGHVVETVASAVFCFLKTPDNFEKTVITAVMGGEDTDTTAAVAGAISGAWNGTWGLPLRWVEAVEGTDEIRELAGKLYSLSLKRGS